MVAALTGTGRCEYALGTHPANLVGRPSRASTPGAHAARASGLLARLAAEVPAPVVITSNSFDPLRLKPYDFAWAAHLSPAGLSPCCLTTRPD